MLIPLWMITAVGMLLSFLIAYVLILRHQRAEMVDDATKIIHHLSDDVEAIARLPIQQFRQVYSAEVLAYKIARRGR